MLTSFQMTQNVESNDEKNLRNLSRFRRKKTEPRMFVRNIQDLSQNHQDLVFFLRNLFSWFKKKPIVFRVQLLHGIDWYFTTDIIHFQTGVSHINPHGEVCPLKEDSRL